MIKLLFRGPISLLSGYGNDGVGMLLAMQRLGIDVRVEPNYVAPPLPEKILPLFGKALDAPFDVVLQHVDPMQLGLSETYRHAAEMLVGWSMWEWTGVQNMVNRSTFKERTKHFDLLVGYDKVTNQALKKVKRAATPIAEVQGGADLSALSYVERDWNAYEFNFCIVGALSDRKNPYALIQAFKELKKQYPEEFASAKLNIKQGEEFIPEIMSKYDNDIRIFSGNWSREKLLDFYAQNHCLVMPSRGEGKNLPCLEMLATGGAVIHTNFGGMASWGNEDYSYPVEYEYRENQTLEGSGANVDITDLKDQMLRVFRNREEAQAKGKLGSQIIPEMMSWDNKIKDLFAAIRDKVPGKGHEIYKKFQEGLPNG